jgi:hypothetical protein
MGDLAVEVALHLGAEHCRGCTVGRGAPRQLIVFADSKLGSISYDEPTEMNVSAEERTSSSCASTFARIVRRHELS